MAFRHQFIAALRLLARATERMEAKGLGSPILVGGAAAELYTGGAISTGDFDFVSNWQTEFFAELEALGFERPNEAGWLRRSLLHREFGFGVEVVSGALMDGHADSKRIRVIDFAEQADENPQRIRVIPVEDLIADRMAQALAGAHLEESMQNQAVRLYQLVEDLDEDYLDRRIRTETGNAASAETLVAWVVACGP